MNDVGFSLNLMSAMLDEAQRDDLSLAERGGLFAAAKIVCDDFIEHIDTKLDENPYPIEKVRSYQWHIGAMLGFDIDNSHPQDQHYRWALGSLDTLRNLMIEAGQIKG